jgi:hypothetical protein
VAAIPLLDDAAGQDDVAAAVVKLNTLITAFNELQAGTTDQIFKKTNATDFNFEACNSLLPASGTANLKIKVLNIGDWNMDTTYTIAVAHGIASYKTIKSVSVVVRDDTDTVYSVSPFLAPDVALFHELDGTAINIYREDPSFFNSVNFDSTSFNRGWITIIYEG